MTQPTPEWLLVSPWAALAGAFGALVSLRSLDGLTPRGRVVAVGGGFGCVIFLTPLSIDAMYALLGWDFIITTRGESGIAFLIGLTGLSVAGEMLKFLPTLRCIFRDWLQRIFGGPK